MKFLYKIALVSVLVLPLLASAASDDGKRREISPQGSSEPQTNQAGGFSERSVRYRLRRGDTFDLEFAYSSDFNQTIAVQPDGYITLRGIGMIPVEGQTLPQLTETISRAYANILRDPVITIALKDFEKPYFIAAGQVSKPGKYELRSDMTVTQALAVAGGLSDQAKHSQVVLFRPVSKDMVEARLLDVKKMLNARDLREDVHLREGDTIFVPQNTISKIRRWLPASYVGVNVSPTQF